MNVQTLNSKLAIVGDVEFCNINNEEGNLFVIVIKNNGEYDSFINSINEILISDALPFFPNVDVLSYANNILKIQLSK